TDEADVAAQAKACLKLIEGDGAANLSAAAARELVKQRPEGAVEALLAFLPFAENEKVAKEAESGLATLPLPGGQGSPAPVKALKDEAPVRRAAAVEVLCKAGDESQLKAVRALLEDPKPSVRFRVALALARRHDAGAVPVLIDLLGELPPAQQTACEEFLADL